MISTPSNYLCQHCGRAWHDGKCQPLRAGDRVVKIGGRRGTIKVIGSRTRLDLAYVVFDGTTSTQPVHISKLVPES